MRAGCGAPAAPRPGPTIRAPEREGSSIREPPAFAGPAQGQSPMLDPRGAGCPQFRAVHVTILSRKLAIYTTRRLAQAARLRGARVRVLDPLGVEMHLDDQPTAFYRRKKLPRTDVVVPRIAPSVQAYGLAVVNHFAMMGVATLNDAAGIAASRNQMRP